MAWHKPLEQFERYLAEQHAGARQVIVAELQGSLAGYVCVVWEPSYPPFRDQSVPEIQDLNVFPQFRRQRVATRLMDAAEAVIIERSLVAGIGVGLHPGYSAAQRLYVRRGYVPDGNGIMYQGVPVREGQQVFLDDELVLHLTKTLIAAPRVREAETADIPAMHRIRLSVRENVLSSPTKISTGDYERMLRISGAGFACTIGNELVGFAIADVESKSIWALFVAPVHERRGFGRMLMERLLRSLTNMGIDHVSLSTEPGTRAETFYRAAGWRQTGITETGELRFELQLSQ
jgi:GNAT superfamily N-acetyltransferase